jgi:ubiquinone/menaquinone biosynthesis C-methylase UbiE
MKTNFVSALFSSILAKIKGALWKLCYQHMAKSYQREDWKFMNYGYAPLDGNPEMMPLEPADAQERYCIQLYRHVASDVDLAGLEVLEIGSGRGGGADYIKRYLKPKTMIGVDFAKDAVAFCNRNYCVDGLSFKVGNAQSLPFADSSFDAVMNVESSHCYPSVEAFLGQVKRVLREGGHFLFADMRDKEDLSVLREQLRKSGMTLIRETEITPNVLRALKLDNERRTSMVKQTVPKSKLKGFLKFAGVEDTKFNKMLKNGEMVYISCLLQKRNGGAMHP